jgi:hypothetical protein
VLIWMAVRVRWWQRLPLVRRWFGPKPVWVRLPDFTTEASRDNGARIEWTEEGVAFYTQPATGAE